MNHCRRIIMFIVLSFLFLITSGCPADVKVSDNFKRISSYIGAQQIEYYSFNDGLTEGVFYHVKLPYPSKEVLKYYDGRLSKEGYKPYVEEYYKYADRDWRNFIDGTKKGEPHVAQLKASWIDPTGTKRANLVLRYYWYVDNQKSEVILGVNDDMNVDFQIMPFMKLPPPQGQSEQQPAK